MKAYQLTAFAEPIEVRDIPTPEPSGTEVLVKVSHAGVCHSDLHIWDGFYDIGAGKRLALGDRGVSLPRTMGHEIVGEIVRAGPDAGDFESDLQVDPSLARLWGMYDLSGRRGKYVRQAEIDWCVS